MAGSLRAPRTVQTDDTTLSLIQDALVKAITDLQNTKVVNSQVLPRVQVQAGRNSISHGLGRNLVGWIVVRTHNSTVQPILTDNQDENPYPNKTLLLVSSDPGSVDLLVF